MEPLDIFLHVNPDFCVHVHKHTHTHTKYIAFSIYPCTYIVYAAEFSLALYKFISNSV